MHGLRSLLGLTIVLFAACGGNATPREACENVIDCAIADGLPESEREDSLNACIDQAIADMASQECLDCVEGASCTELAGDTCDNACQ
jgi:hypothetical protein